MVALAGTAAAVGWIVHQSRAISRDLTVVQASASRFGADLAARDPAAARRALADISSLMRDAQGRADGRAWGATVDLPVAGRPARTVRGLVDAASRMARTVLPDLVDVVERLGPVSASSFGGGVDLPTVAAIRPALDDALANLVGISAELRALPQASGSGRVDQALSSLSKDTATMLAGVSRADTAARLAPPMLGADGVRRYFLAIQTNAEARGTAGLVGAYAIVSADHGRLRFDRFGSDDDIPSAATAVVDLGPRFDMRYGGDGAARSLADSNLSPHFPYAAAVWAGLWQRATGQRLDGALATDPIGLGSVLAVTGPVTLPDGERVTAADVARVTEQDAYARYPDPKARKAFLVEMARAVGNALQTRQVAPVAMLRALTTMADSGRLRLWSAHPSEQSLLAGTELGGVLPGTSGPFAALVVNNAAGTKLDYYLYRSVDYRLGDCRGGRRPSTVRIVLENTAPPKGLPTYVTRRSDAGSAGRRPGSNRLWVSLYAGLGARLTRATLDGAPARVSPGLELGRPVFSAFLEIAPGQRRVLELALDESAVAAAPTVPVQPLVRPQVTEVSGANCAG